MSTSGWPVFRRMSTSGRPGFRRMSTPGWPRFRRMSTSGRSLFDGVEHPRHGFRLEGQNMIYFPSVTLTI
jgi:hypothetical protein